MRNISVFDFDGTIANTIPVSITILKKFARTDFNRDLNDKQIKELRDKPIPEVFKALNVPLFKLPAIAHKTRQELNKEIGKLKPIKGVRTMLKDLLAQGHTLGIVSSNSRESIQKFLDGNDMKIFDFIYTNSQIFGKAGSLKKVVKEYKCNKKDVTYFGDEIRDIEAARKAGVRIASVTWGVNSKAKLQAYSPDFLVDNPAEISVLFK